MEYLEPLGKAYLVLLAYGEETVVVRMTRAGLAPYVFPPVERKS